MNNTDKKKWSTPRLRIFVRTRSEERVLAGCKLDDTGGKGPGLTDTQCWSVPVFAECEPCSSIALS